MNGRIFPILDRPRLVKMSTANPTPNVIYRGKTISNFMEAEFENYKVRGYSKNIYHIRPDVPLTELKAGFPLKEDWIVERDREWITGGFTNNVGTAVHFSSSDVRDIGTVLVLDRDKIDEEIIDFRYERDFYEQHPVLVPHVETLGRGVIIQDGEIVATTQKVGAEESIGQAGGELWSSVLKTPFFKDEAEAVAYARQVDISEAIIGMTTWAGADERRTFSYEYWLKVLYGEVRREEKYQNIYADLLQTSVDALPTYSLDKIYLEDIPMKVKVNALWNIVNEMLGRHAHNLHIGIVKGDIQRNVKKEHEVVSPDKFKFIHNGEKFIEDYDEARPFVG